MNAENLPTIVLVHGAWHGAWCWDHLIAELTRRGWPASAVLDLPSATGDPDAGLYDDARALREHLARFDEPVIVLAHSYGGLPVTEAAADVPNVRQLIYLSAHMFNEGESLVSPVGGPWYPPETRLIMPPDNPRELFYHDVPAVLADDAVSRLRPQSARSFEEPLTRASWKSIPSAYIVCDDDRVFPEGLADKLASRADVVGHLPGSHSPFLAQPTALADTLEEATWQMIRSSS
jgi:pimeloyl-ACP methyl ester carboxylesterase